MTQLHTIYQEGSQKKFRRVSAPKPKVNVTAEVSIPDNIPTFPKKVVSEVKAEIAKEDLKHALQQERRLSNLIEQSQKPLFKCKSVFPFDLFPDEITVEPTQVNIKKKTFFFTAHMITIPIDNISDIHIHTSPFFAELTFVDRSFVENLIRISFLKKADASKMRKIVQGLIVATKENVDVGKIERGLLKAQAEELGDMKSLTL